MAGFWDDIVGAVSDVVDFVQDVPFVSSIPFVGTALGAADLATGGLGMLGIGNQPKKKAAPAPAMMVPQVPGAYPMGLAKTSASSYSAMPAPLPQSFDPNPGILPRGPGGSLSVPFTNPDVAAALQPYSLDDQFLRTYYRAPPGYVVVRDANGKPFPVMKKAARMMGLWKPAKKPPISVRDWSALKRANSTVKKIKQVVKMAENVANFKAQRKRPAKAC